MENSSELGSLRWWLPDYKGDKERAESCWRWMNRIRARQVMRNRAYLFFAQMYEDLPALGLGPFSYSTYNTGGDYLRLNLVRAVVNTFVSQIVKSKPKPRVLTSDGDWSLKKRAKGLTRWFEGKADETELYKEISGPCCRDSGAFGTGIAKVYRENYDDPDHWDVGVERVFPWELLADDAEAQASKRMRTIGQRKYYDRQVLCEMFPKSKQAIKRIPRYQGDELESFDWTADSTADLVCVLETWRLPYRDGGTDGRHCIVVEGKTLYDGSWERKRFPFAFLYRDKPTMGVFGVSLAHELRGIQQYINTTLLDIEECLHLYGKPRWMVAAGSVIKDHLDDDLDSITEFTGQIAPVVYSPQVIPPEQYAFLWQMWQKGFDQTGLSQARSEGETAPGLSGSGASIRAWNDVGDGRMFDAGENFQDFHMAIADRMIDEARDISETRTDYASVWRGKTYVEIVEFRKVDPGRDQYYLHVYPESRLSKSPAQRLAQLQEMLNGGVITHDEFRELLEFPDIEGEDNLLNSPRELAEKLISKFLEAEDPDADGVFQYPEAEWSLDSLSMRFQYAEIRARLDNAPEGNCRLLREFIRLCDALKAENLAKSQAAAEAAGAPPQLPGAPGHLALPAPPPPAGGMPQRMPVGGVPRAA